MYNLLSVVTGMDFFNCRLFLVEQLLRKSTVFVVINIFNLTVEILFVVDVGQFNLTRLVGAYLYMCTYLTYPTLYV